MTPEARKEYDIMAARLASMYGAKWDKDAKTRRMVVQAAKVSAWNNKEMRIIAKKINVPVEEIRTVCMKMAKHYQDDLEAVLTTLKGMLKGGYSWDDFVKFVNKECGGTENDTGSKKRI